MEGHQARYLPVESKGKKKDWCYQAKVLEEAGQFIDVTFVFNNNQQFQKKKNEYLQI